MPVQRQTEGQKRYNNTVSHYPCSAVLCTHSEVKHTCFLMRSETSSASSDTAFLFGLKSSSESSSSFPLPAAKLRRCCGCCCDSTDQALLLAGSASRRTSCSCGRAGTKVSERRPGVAAATPRAERATARSSPWRAEHEDNAITTVFLPRISSNQQGRVRRKGGNAVGGGFRGKFNSRAGCLRQNRTPRSPPQARISFFFSSACIVLWHGRGVALYLPSLRAGEKIPCLGSSTHRLRSRSWGGSRA